MLARSSLPRNLQSVSRWAISTRSLTTAHPLTPLRPLAQSHITPLHTAKVLAQRRYRSTEPPSPLSSVPSAAENTGTPAVDHKRGKFYESVDEAVKDIKSGSTVLSAGKWLRKSPFRLPRRAGCDEGIHKAQRLLEA